MIAALTAEEAAAGAENDWIGTSLVLAGDGMRVWHLRLEPVMAMPPHRHDRPYFWTVLTDGKGRSRYADGRIAEHEYRAGDARDFPDLTPDNAFVHDLTNIGKSALLFVTVEFDIELAPGVSRPRRTVGRRSPSPSSSSR